MRGSPGWYTPALAAAEANNHATNNKSRRRLLAKMAFAYQEAGFEIGDFVAFVIYPLTTTEPPGEWAPGIPLRSAIGWETAARNVLK